MFKFYLTKSDRNDATSYYVGIIEKAVKLMGEEISYIEDADSVTSDDYVLTINPKTFYAASKKKPKALINWFQGVLPEESWFANIPKWKQIAAFIYYRILERYALKHSSLNFFVSNTMREHYERVYNYKKNNYFIMPCFNQLLQESAFSEEKFGNPSFVYTGNLSKWQCFIPMVKLFKDIKQHLPSATLAIYTQDQDDAKNILSIYGVEATIRYVPYQQLAEEIKQYKYGFILREDVVVNRVATPTKMNSYLSCGIIPIYTDVIGGYKENLGNMKYAIPLKPNSNEGIDKLYKLENGPINSVEILEEYKTVFERYYNEGDYVKGIAASLRNHLS